MRLDLKSENRALLRCVEAFNDFLDTELNAQSGDQALGGVLIALSGGSDSMLLLEFMRRLSIKYGIYIAAAHVNHGIRGTEADNDEAFCEEWCERNSIDFFHTHFDVPGYSAENKIGLEEAARILRYGYLDSLLNSDKRLAYIATAHHADDNLETMILNLLRGCGTRGLSGIPPVRGRIIRPLLFAKKKDIGESLSELGIPFVTDSTNFDNDIKRNFVRNNILPLLDQISADPQKSATRASKCLRYDDDALDLCAKEFVKNDLRADMSGALYLTRSDLANLSEGIAYRVIASAAKEACGKSPALEFSHIKSTLRLCADGDKYFSLSLPDGIVAIGESDRVYFRNARECDGMHPRFDISLELGKNVIPGSGVLYLSREPIEEFEEKSLSFSNNCSIFNADSGVGYEFANSITNVYKIFIQAELSSAKIIGNLSARSRISSDSYKYGGVTRKLKKLFSDRKIPLKLRDRIPVLYDDRGIVWVPGFGVRDDGSFSFANQGDSSRLYAYFCYTAGKALPTPSCRK